MGNKAIQRKRMQRYLIDATKTIICKDGVEAVTVRKVADLAGYSYATMYNYFADLNELLWFVMSDYLDEIITLIAKTQKEHPEGGAAELKEVYRAYIEYYLKNPAVYRFAFFQKLGEPPPEVAAKLATPVLANKQMLALNQCAKEGLIQLEDVEIVGEMVTNLVHGLLLFYFSERMQVEKNDIITKMETMIEYLLQDNKRRG